MRTNRGKMGFLVLVLAMLMLTFSGCTGATGTTEEELVREVLEVHAGMESVRYEMEMTVETEAMGKTTIVDMTGGGVIDFVDERMSMTMNTATLVEDEEMEMKMEMYFVDGFMYTKMDIPDVPATWMKMESPMGIQTSSAEQMIRLLETSEVEIIGGEEVRGINTYKIKLIPDAQVLFEIVMEQMGMPTEEVPPPRGDEEVFTDITIKQWIAQDTFLPMKESMEMTMTILGMPMALTSTMHYYDHNEPITIELPPEAADAKCPVAMFEDMEMPTFEEYMSGAIIPAELAEADMERLEELYNKTIAEPENKEAWNQFWDLKEELKIEW